MNNTMYWAKEFFYSASFSVEELNEIGETESPSSLSRRNLHPRVMVDQAGRPLPPKKNLAF